jgi:hypothetical protein
MEWKEITLDNEWYVQWLFDREIPFVVGFMDSKGEIVYATYIQRKYTSFMVARGGYYFYEVPPLEIKKV